MNIFDEYKHKTIEDIITECRNEVNSRKKRLENLQKHILKLDNSIATILPLKVKAEKLFDDAIDKANNNIEQCDNDDEYDNLSKDIKKCLTRVEMAYDLFNDAITQKEDAVYKYQTVEQIKDIYQQQVINFELNGHVKYT